MATTEFGDPVAESAVTEFGDPLDTPSPAPGTKGVPRVEANLDLASEPSLRDTITNAAGRVASGAVSGTQNLAGGLLKGTASLGNAVAAPFQLGQDALQGQPLGTAHAQAAQGIDADARSIAQDPDSLNFAVGGATPELLATAGPLGAGANALAAGARRVLPRALARFAPAAGDVAVNAGYEAAKANAQGGDVGDAAQTGAIGATVGHGVGGVLAHGVSPMLNAAQQRLAQAGITLTPGQMMGKAGTFVEDLASNLPFVGGAIDRSRTRAVNEYSRAEVNKALAHINATTKETGEDAVAQARKIISDAYERNKANVFISPGNATQALRQAEQEFQNIPMLDAQQLNGTLLPYVQRRILPHISNGQPIDGPLWKSIDSELGDIAARYRASSTPTDAPLADAFRKLQNQWRDNVEGKVKGAAEGIQRTNAARRALYPLEDASEKAVGKMGHFNPTQMAQAANRAEQDAGELNRLGREMLTDRRPLGRTLTRLGIGGGGAPVVGTLAHLAGASPVVAAGATAAATAGAGVAANAIYNPAMLKFVLHGLSMSPHGFTGSARSLASLPPEQAASEIQRLSAKYPSFAQAVAQLGRAYSMQRQPQEATP